MSLIFNNTSMSKVFFDGKQIARIYCNGQQVYEKTPTYSFNVSPGKLDLDNSTSVPYTCQITYADGTSRSGSGRANVSKTSQVNGYSWNLPVSVSSTSKSGFSCNVVWYSSTGTMSTPVATNIVVDYTTSTADISNVVISWPQTITPPLSSSVCANCKGTSISWNYMGQMGLFYCNNCRNTWRIT